MNKEIWKETKDGQKLCALISGNKGFLMYLRHSADVGFTSRNPSYMGPEKAMIEYTLNNGQVDEFPASWAIPVEEIEKALEYFDQSAAPPPFIHWHNDSDDGAVI